MTNEEATNKVKEEMGGLSTSQLLTATSQIMLMWDRAIESSDKTAFKIVRNLIFEMNEWLGWEPPRIFVENLEVPDPKIVIAQYCSIILAIVAEQAGDGEMKIDRDAWGTKRDICTVGGVPYSEYVLGLMEKTLPNDGVEYGENTH